jgi:hypothetical protein
MLLREHDHVFTARLKMYSVRQAIPYEIAANSKLEF